MVINETDTLLYLCGPLRSGYHLTLSLPLERSIQEIKARKLSVFLLDYYLRYFCALQPYYLKSFLFSGLLGNSMNDHTQVQ